MRNSLFQTLDNATVAAFAGAFAAFVLVAATDWRRRRRSKRQPSFLISDNADLARAKHRTVQNSIDMMREDNKFAPAPIMPFPVAAIKTKHVEVIDLLDSNENQGLGALIYWMEAIDSLLAEILSTAKHLQQAIELDADTPTRARIGKRILSDLDDAARNLGFLIQMCDWYVAGTPHKILEMQHPILNRGDT